MTNLLLSIYCISFMIFWHPTTATTVSCDVMWGEGWIFNYLFVVFRRKHIFYFMLTLFYSDKFSFLLKFVGDLRTFLPIFRRK